MKKLIAFALFSALVLWNVFNETVYVTERAFDCQSLRLITTSYFLGVPIKKSNYLIVSHEKLAAELRAVSTNIHVVVAKELWTFSGARHQYIPEGKLVSVLRDISDLISMRKPGEIDLTKLASDINRCVHHKDISGLKLVRDSMNQYRH